VWSNVDPNGTTGIRVKNHKAPSEKTTLSNEKLFMSKSVDFKDSVKYG
jgi:hypothetical protein